MKQSGDQEKYLEQIAAFDPLSNPDDFKNVTLQPLQETDRKIPSSTHQTISVSKNENPTNDAQNSQNTNGSKSNLTSAAQTTSNTSIEMTNSNSQNSIFENGSRLKDKMNLTNIPLSFNDNSFSTFSSSQSRFKCIRVNKSPIDPIRRRSFQSPKGGVTKFQSGRFQITLSSHSEVSPESNEEDIETNNNGFDDTPEYNEKKVESANIDDDDDDIPEFVTGPMPVMHRHQGSKTNSVPLKDEDSGSEIVTIF
ncbi:hypothetical protein TRFO_16784 [Tritrichomonas foetus]|uniref:Uncharacterized protein n=1 Tax=Tritrichomonas foetus TaxID=1144522 RepID=A0A1J4KUN9_9EUKA|nr:hypothetical protein TRFO_16784 [Tritrichomonas foetus]|eukprot:OHT13213.1 hypothetical protein TRFO_16784 [Tritrichomonas foetus]